MKIFVGGHVVHRGTPQQFGRLQPLRHHKGQCLRADFLVPGDGVEQLRHGGLHQGPVVLLETVEEWLFMARQSNAGRLTEGPSSDT